MFYCTIADVQSILPDNIVIGDNLLEENVTILEEDVERFIEFATNIINSQLGNIYKTPLTRIKLVDRETNPPTFSVDFPEPVRLICSRLSAAQLFDEVINANQEPNIVDWGKNQRNLAYDDLRRIASGMVRLKGQCYQGNRFRRQELLDDPRLSRPGELQLPNRSAGT